MLVQKQFQDIFTFSRASTGTRINAAGVLETVAANQPRFDYDASGAFWNLQTFSNDITIAGWTGPNITKSYGAIARNSAIASAYVSSPAFPTPFQIGANFTAAARVKAKSVGGRFGLRPSGGYPSRCDAVFDLVSGTVVGAAASGGYSNHSASISGPDVEGYYTVCVSGTVGSSPLTNIVCGPTDSTLSVTNWEATSAVFSDCYIHSVGIFSGTLSAAQIVAAGGIPLTTAAPACNPSQVIARGILIEEQRTNRWTNSAWPGISFQSAALSITTNYGATPISGVNSTRLVRAADGSATTFNFNSPGSAPASPQAPSVFFRLNSAQTSLSVYAGNGNSTQGRYFNFSVSGGVITPTDGGIAQTMGNGFWRLSFPFTPGSAITSGANLVFTIPAGALDCELVGFQWEDGSLATSYIPTSGSQVTRAADNLSINTLSPWFNAAASTVMCEFDVLALPFVSYPWVYSLSDGSDNNKLGLYGNNGNNQLVASVASAGVSQIGYVFRTLNAGVNKEALSVGGSGMSFASNGAAPTTASVAAMPVGMNSLSIGSNRLSGNHLNGHIRKIRYFPKRLTDAQLQALTA